VKPAGFPEAATERAAGGEHGAVRERNEPEAIEVAFPKAGMGSDSPAQRRLPNSHAGATSPGDAGREALTGPVKILSKPRPLYPAQAREYRLQGDVLIDVEFRYSGTIEILGVRQGLSSALNESALEATRKIRFLPARRDGRPVDTQATVCIRFQIAP
jgi:TonB family protein